MRRPPGDAPSAAPAPPTPMFNQPPLTGVVGPPLDEIRMRELFRRRNPGEVEEVTWYLADEPSGATATAAPQPQPPRSLDSVQPAVIRFTNSSGRAVRLLWMDYEGHESPYHLLRDDATCEASTYVTHPWVARDATTGAPMMLAGAPVVWGSEEAQHVVVAASAGARAPPQPMRLASLHSKQGTTVTFGNRSSRRVCLLWLDNDGDEVAYNPLEPGATRTYQSFATHPWIARDVATGARMLLDGAGAVVAQGHALSVEIFAPPALEWAKETHAAFPKDFRGAVRLLLLAHHAPAVAGYSGAPANGALVALGPRRSARLLAAAAPTAPGRCEACSAAQATPGCDSRKRRSPEPCEAGDGCAGCKRATVAGRPGQCPEASAVAEAWAALPMHLVLRIIELAAPAHWQGLHLPPVGRRDIKPTLLACVPPTAAPPQQQADVAAAHHAAGANLAVALAQFVGGLMDWSESEEEGAAAGDGGPEGEQLGDAGPVGEDASSSDGELEIEGAGVAGEGEGGSGAEAASGGSSGSGAMSDGAGSGGGQAVGGAPPPALVAAAPASAEQALLQAMVDDMRLGGPAQ